MTTELKARRVEGLQFALDAIKKDCPQWIHDDWVLFQKLPMAKKMEFLFYALAVAQSNMTALAEDRGHAVTQEGSGEKETEQ